jgi:hypothetical protein
MPVGVPTPPEPTPEEVDMHDGVLRREIDELQRAGHVRLRRARVYLAFRVTATRIAGSGRAVFRSRGIGNVLANEAATPPPTVRPIGAVGTAWIDVGPLTTPVEWDVRSSVRGVQNPTDEMIAAAAVALLEEEQADARAERRRDLKTADELEAAARALRSEAARRRKYRNPWSDE